MAKCGMKEEVVIPYDSFTLQVNPPQYIFSIVFRVQGTKPFNGIHDHEGVAFMSIKF